MAHDPWTRIFSIPSFLTHYNDGIRHRYWVPLLEVWHVDPETDGTEYSCQNRLHRKFQDPYIHICWKFWHWRLRFPIIRYLVRWIRGRCGLCGKTFGMHSGTCGHLGSSKHEYHPECYDIVSKRFRDAMYARWGCEFVFGDGKPCENIANYAIPVSTPGVRGQLSNRCFRHVPSGERALPIDFAPVKVNGM